MKEAIYQYHKNGSSASNIDFTGDQTKQSDE